ncbi:MAG: DUF5367 family protein [Terriglobales bacterium]
MDIYSVLQYVLFAAIVTALVEPLGGYALDISSLIDEHELMFDYNKPLFLCGLGIWLTATVALRLAGQHLLRPRHPVGTAILFAVSFPLMAWMVRRLCSRFRLRPEEWPSGAISIALPTLLLDPFSSAFFPVVFPNMAPELAGVFGGWMLWCCAGAMLGASLRPGRRS